MKLSNYCKINRKLDNSRLDFVCKLMDNFDIRRQIVCRRLRGREDLFDNSTKQVIQFRKKIPTK